METASPQASRPKADSPGDRPPQDREPSQDFIDFREAFRRIGAGMLSTIGLTLIGLAVGALGGLFVGSTTTAVTSLRVRFGFPGLEKGTYPNGSKFQADDLRAPDVVSNAIDQLGAQGLSTDISSRVRGAIGVNGLVSEEAIKERDRLRASGQALPPYVPDEYEISLSLPRSYVLDVRQRELLLSAIVSAYQAKFRQTYVELPKEFGNALNSLNGADYPEYELVLGKEVQLLEDFLQDEIDKARQFRSPRNNLSFGDLLKETELYSRLTLDDVLSEIYASGVSRDPQTALAKMDYYQRILDDKVSQLKDNQDVLSELISKSGERNQNYVVASKVQTPQNGQPVLDETFIDSLLNSDAYNFLVRRALGAGMDLKAAQAEKDRLVVRREHFEKLLKSEARDPAPLMARLDKELVGVKASYGELIARIRVVLEDYSQQEYGDSIRITKQPTTRSVYFAMLVGAAVGLGIGLSLGLGMSLLKAVPSEPSA